MSVLTDKHGNTLRSANSERVNFLMTMAEFQELVMAANNSRSKMEMQVNCVKVWKKLGEKYDFDYRSVHRPVGESNSPRAFSAIPNSNEDNVSESTGG